MDGGSERGRPDLGSSSVGRLDLGPQSPRISSMAGCLGTNCS